MPMLSTVYVKNLYVFGMHWILHTMVGVETG